MRKRWDIGWILGISKWLKRRTYIITRKKNVMHGSMYLNGWKKTYIITRKKLDAWFNESKETFSKRFKIVVGLAYNEKLKIKRLLKIVKISSALLLGTITLFYPDLQMWNTISLPSVPSISRTALVPKQAATGRTPLLIFLGEKPQYLIIQVEN